VSFPIFCDFSYMLYMVIPWFLGLGMSKPSYGLGKESHISVSGQAVSETFIFEYPDGRIRGGLFGIICRSCSCDRFEWSFTQFGWVV
jgi:hypothetical protein